MTRPQGFSKTGGRKKGTPNCNTIHFIEKLDSNNFDPVNELMKIYPKLSDELKAKYCIRMLDFLYPKRKSVALSDELITEESKTVFIIPSNGREASR